MTHKLDDIDYKILYLLQRDAALSVADIAVRVGLTPTPCWKRIKKMQEDKVILGSVMLVDPAKIDCPLVVFVMVKTSDHSEEWAKTFIEVVRSFPEIVSLYRITGEYDYLLNVVVKDVAAYDSLYRRMVKKINVKIFDVTSVFALEILKRSTVIPTPIVDKQFLEKVKNIVGVSDTIYSKHEPMTDVNADGKPVQELA